MNIFNLNISEELIENFDYGILPTNVDLFMTQDNYTFTIALLGLVCAFVFWLGWNAKS